MARTSVFCHRLLQIMHYLLVFEVSASWALQHPPQQLPIPEQLWNSISMDFIEQLPVSLGFTAILVVVCCLTKQSIFIPTYDTITSANLAHLFVLHIFSKHGVPSHVTSDRGSEIIVIIKPLDEHLSPKSTTLI
jgi:hypothetical protein